MKLLENPPILPRKVLIEDFNRTVYIPNADTPHKPQYRVQETLLELLSRTHPRDDVVNRFERQDVFFGPDKMNETMLACKDWILPIATCWMFTTMSQSGSVLKVDVPIAKHVETAALIEIPIRVTEEESPLSSMFKLIAIADLLDLHASQSN